MEKLTIVSIVASYVATFFIQLTTLFVCFDSARYYLGIWFLSRKIQFSIGIFVIAFEFNHDLLDPNKQTVLAREIDHDSITSLDAVIDVFGKLL
ncbi:MAG: hypothetical protein E6Q34_06330 [Burkholderiaceae bacterium]|nr:MAG: hypothetical protein E6Q34_06330 [Burkholderiaceae bacterium]